MVIEVELRGVEKLSKGQINRAMKAANKAAGVHFRRNFLPARFTQQGGRRLKYTPRSGESRVGLVNSSAPKQTYAARKQRHLGHSDPLVFSGEGKRLALATPTKVTSTKSKITIPLPRKYNFRNPKSRVRMADEIRSVTPREAKKLSAFLAQQIDRELNKLAGVSRRSRVETASISNL
jgi:hypothetical protein